MLAPPKKLFHAIDAVLDIAWNAGADPVPGADVTRRQDISRRYLEPVLQQLVRAGILIGVRGPKGGYRLARERRRITLGDITRVVMSGEDDPRDSGSDLGRHVVLPLWDELDREAMERLDAVSIEDLCVRAREKGLESERIRNLDFSI